MPLSWANLQKVWVRVADCKFILLLFPTASAPLTGGEHLYTQIVSGIGIKVPGATQCDFL